MSEVNPPVMHITPEVRACSHVSGVMCNVVPCHGDGPAGADYCKTLAWLRRSAFAAAIDPAIRDRVNACPDRGNELPVSAYAAEGCCSGATRFECRGGKGFVAGQPTLAECLACKANA